MYWYWILCYAILAAIFIFVRYVVIIKREKHPKDFINILLASILLGWLITLFVFKDETVKLIKGKTELTIKDE